eukprot:658342-Prymnesium_polylepis.1
MRRTSGLVVQLASKAGQARRGVVLHGPSVPGLGLRRELESMSCAGAGWVWPPIQLYGPHAGQATF